MSFKKIFKKGSKTYYNSSKFFCKEDKRDIEILYAFVRTADDYVDKISQDKRSFLRFKKMYYDMIKEKALNSSEKKSKDYLIIRHFIDLSVRKKFNPQWTVSFLNAMEADLKKRKYNTLAELEEYMYGSAEVIGLFMCRILGIPRKAEKYAMMLGKAMQYINFIRDVKEDELLGRTYLPVKETIKITGKKDIIDLDEKSFEKIIHAHIERYFRWQFEAEKGFKYIPKKSLIPIKTASDMYKWTANKIYENPSVVLKKKLKPSKIRILIAGLRNGL